MVIGLHAALAWLLLSSMRVERAREPSAATIVYMVQSPAPKVEFALPKAGSLSLNPKSFVAPLLPVPTLPAIVVTETPPSIGNGPVDWRGDAAAVAAKTAPSLAGSVLPSEEAAAPKSAFREPQHQAGDQETLNGQRVVWVNSKCYQMSSPPGMADSALIPRTVCPGLRASDARGDLFDKLPAYKKNSVH